MVQTRVAVLNEIKSNFAYIYDKIRLIKRCEEQKQKELQDSAAAAQSEPGDNKESEPTEPAENEAA